MARLLYSLAFYLATPLILLRLRWRARKQPAYWQHLGERYGYYPQFTERPLIWLHAVSVGETRAAAPLIEVLLRDYPDHALLLTHMTPTGRETGAEYGLKYPGRLFQAYLPYDLPDACGRFLGHFQPRFGLLMETELWPNLIAAARMRSIPLLLINARLSARSQRGYARLTGLIGPALAALGAVAAQTPADAARLTALGAHDVRICGNLKFDAPVAAEKLALGAHWKQSLAGRRVWLAASMREGEEALMLDALSHCRVPGLLLLLVPRHPQRFDEVAALVHGRGLNLCRRSEKMNPGAETQVWLGDSMGEMAAYYAAADLALIGGSLLPFGGQNLIEAAACGCPVLVGPHSFNFAQATQDAIDCGAAQRVIDANDAASVAESLLNDRDALQAMRDAALQFSQAHRGATARTVALIREVTAPQTRD
jgi:3-deoxy-D-manno-octulosonic-acid transferase